MDRRWLSPRRRHGVVGAKLGLMATFQGGRQAAREDRAFPRDEIPLVHRSGALRNGRPLISIGLALCLVVLVLSVLAAVPQRGSAGHLLGTSFGGVITESTTWDLAGSPYTLTQDVTVAGGITLTIDPGVTVRGQATTELLVLGHLRAVGTPAQPITFTSASDSGPNQWAGLVFNGGTGHLRHATARYAGYGNSVRQGNIVARDVLSGQVLIEDSQVLTGTTPSGGSRSYGLYADNSHVVVSSTLFSDIGDASDDYAIYATGADTILTVTNSTFKANSGWPVRVEADDVHRITGNSFSGNGRNRILVDVGTVVPDATLTRQSGLDGYELSGSIALPGQGMIVPDAGTLTLQPGVTVVGQDGAELRVLGHLQAVGTPAQPITFTSASDSGPNQWAGLVFDGGTGHLRHATVRYAGRSNSVRYGNIVARDVLSGQVLIEDSQVLTGTTPSGGSRSYGLYVDNSHVIVSNTLISGIGDASDDYAIYAAGSGTVMTITNSRLRENNGYGIRVNNGQATVNCTTITSNPGGGIWVTGGGLSAIGSDISSNVQFGLQNDSGARVDARYNWWGGTDGPYHPTYNSGGLAESEVSDDVDFIPWLEVATCSPLIDLSVAKSGLPNPALVGSALTYTIYIANNSPAGDSVTGVALTDTLAMSVTVASATASQGSCAEAGTSVRCDLDALTGGAAATVTIVVTPTTVGIITNSVNVAINEADVVPSNNSTEIDTVVIANPTDPAILSFSPESLMQGATRTLTILGVNFFTQGLTVTLSRGDRGEPDPGDVMGNILSAIAHTIEVELDIASPDFVGEWDVIVENPNGKTASRPIYIDAAIVWLDHDQDGIRGYPVVPPGQERGNYLWMFNMGYADGLALVTITPPDPGWIRLIIGPRWDPVWDSTEEAPGDKISVTVVVPFSAGEQLSLPLFWGISPEDLSSPLRASAATNNRPRLGQYRPLEVSSLQGATRHVAKGMVRNIIINSICDNLKGQIQGKDVSILDSAVDATIAQLEGATDPRNIMGTIANHLMQVPAWVGIAQSIGTCSGELVNVFISSFHANVKQLADRIRDDSRAQLEIQRRVAKNPRGAITANRALIEAYSKPPCNPAASYRRTYNGQIRGPWDPNDKGTYTTFGCELGVSDSITECVRYFIPMPNASDPITYVIQFENKEEATAPAENILITDVLDSNLNPSTLEVYAISHPTASFTTEVAGNTATFQFVGLNLPPNQNPPEGQGYVIFSVKPDAGLPQGAEIRNKASIVFDFNPPIDTPEVIHVLVGKVYLPVVLR